MGVDVEYIQEDKPLGTLNAIRLGMESLKIMSNPLSGTGMWWLI